MSMSIFNIEDNWKVKIDLVNIQLSIDLELSMSHMVAGLQNSNDFDIGWYHYDENYILISLYNNAQTQNVLLVGTISANGQLEGALQNITQLSTGQQFVGMDFYIPETGNHFSLGGVLEVKDGRIAMNGLSMNPDADSFNTWSAWERY